MRPILIADDDADIRSAVRLILEDAGYHVDETANTRETLHLLRTTPDSFVVLLDLIMPSDGENILDRLAHDLTLFQRHTYILFTASVQIPQAALHLKLAVISKPFDLDTLLTTIASVTAPPQ